jgi:hypothetical protein
MNVSRDLDQAIPAPGDKDNVTTFASEPARE